MTRYLFGGDMTAWAFTPDGADVPVLEGGGLVTGHNAETGGSQYEDWQDLGGAAISSVFTEDGSGTRTKGVIPPFYGPDGVWAMWISVNGGPRSLMISTDVATVLGPKVTSLEAAFTAHTGAGNPHAMATTDLTDFSTDTAADGQIPVYDSDTGLYVPTTVVGPNPSDFVSTHGGSTITIPSGDTTTEALTVRLPSGVRDGGANAMEVWWNAGSEAVPNWFLVTRLDEYGQLRGRASAANRVWGKIQQFSAGQTADLLQFLDFNGNPLSWVDAGGRVRAPNLGIMAAWTQETGTAGVGTYRVYNPTGQALTLRGFTVSAGGTAPAGGDFVIAPKLDGVELYSSANRPKLTAGQRFSGIASGLNSSAWPAGSYLTVDVLTVPSTAPTKITIQALAY